MNWSSLISYADEVFLGIPLQVYSTILATAVLVILALLVAHIIAFVFCKKIREKTLAISYFTIIKIIGAFAFLATILALTYQYGFMLVVCELCWWQRVFMFPIEFIALSSSIKKIRGNELAIALLTAFGLFYAGYHYYLHFQTWVLKNTNVTSNCSVGGILPSCTDSSGVVIYGFVTIPFMSLIIFLLIAWLTFLAFRINKREQAVSQK